MKAKPSKCKSLAQKKFDNRYPNKVYAAAQTTTYSAYDPLLKISGKELEFIRDNHFKYMGRFIQADCEESKIRSHIQVTLKEWLDIIDKSIVGDNMKLWLYNIYVLSKISWWLIACYLTLSFVEHLQCIALPYLKIWSGLPRAANPTILFSGKYADIGLKLKTIPGLWKQLVSKQHMQKYSNDPHLKEMFRTCLEKENLGLSSLKFLPTVELELAEASMRSKIDEQQGAFGNTQRHGLGFGVNTKSKERKVSQNVNTGQNRENRKLIASHLQQIETEDQIGQLRTLSMQGNWTNWDNIMSQDLSWKRLTYGMSDNLLKFLRSQINDNYLGN